MILMKVLNVLSRIYLEDGELDRVIAFYEHLLNESCQLRFTHSRLGLELGQVGSILFIAGSRENLEPVKSTQMTFLVDSINDFRDALVSKGAIILEGPNEVPTGFNMRVRHPDGTIVEYVEHRK
ncbi:dioxygenase [Alicyclobacillus contaminans]|nr:dioxygenase [Alicyclobacillus contaminans]